MSSTPDQNPFAPPTARVDDVAVAGGLELGGRGARLGAVLIDGVIQAVAYGLVVGTVFASVFPSLGKTSDPGLFMIVFGALASMVLFVLIQGYLLVTSGQTIGKKLLGLRIVRSNGERADGIRLLGRRYLLIWLIASIPVIGWIFAVVDSLMIFRDSRLCLHDNIADTMVVKA
jgi:uncharacterized RDD family membrane protein YckC